MGEALASSNALYNRISGLNSAGSRVASTTVAHRRCADNGRDQLLQDTFAQEGVFWGASRNTKIGFRKIDRALRNGWSDSGLGHRQQSSSHACHQHSCLEARSVAP